MSGRAVGVVFELAVMILQNGTEGVSSRRSGAGEHLERYRERDEGPRCIAW